MKKVKLMLAGIAILTLVAGTFAFKAKKAFLCNLYYTTATTYVGKSCCIPATTTTEVQFVTSYYYLTVQWGPCLSFKTHFAVPD